MTLLEKNQRRILDYFYLAISPILVFVATFLPLTVLKTLELESRVFLSFGGFFFYIGILLSCLSKATKQRILKWITVILLILCIFFQYSYVYVYGNALKCQKEYEKYIVYNMAHELEVLNSNEEFKTVSFVGDTPRARQLQMMCDKYPFLEDIVPVYFGNSTWLGGVWLYHYLQNDLVLEEPEDADLQIVHFEEPIIENSIYCCYLNGEKIIISFR